MGKLDKNISFTLITLVIGFMIAIQFQTVSEPVVRDTRDTWQLREDLYKEKEVYSQLLKEVRAIEEKIAKYESKRQQSKEQALKETLEELKKESGLTEVSGPGIVLEITPLQESILLGESIHTVSPDLLKRLINELNMYNAKYISVDGQRYINTTVIRDINGETKINGHALNRLPFEIIVVVEDYESAKRLYNQMQVSNSISDFFIDNLSVKISNPMQKLVVPAYQDAIRIRYMESVK